METYTDYDIEAGYVSYHIYRSMRNFDLVINSIRNFTNWELIVTAFDIMFVYDQCNSLISLSSRMGIESDDLGIDVLRFDEAY